MGNGKVQEGEPGFLLLLSPGLPEDCKGHLLPGGFPAAGTRAPLGCWQQLWLPAASQGSAAGKDVSGPGPFLSLQLPQTILFLPREDPEISVCYICCKAGAEPGLLPMYSI